MRAGWLVAATALAALGCGRRAWVAPPPSTASDNVRDGMIRVFARAASEREDRFHEALHPGSERADRTARLLGGDLAIYREEGYRLFALDAPWDPREPAPSASPVHMRGVPATADATRCLGCHHVGGDAGSGDYVDLAYFDADRDDVLSARRRLPPMLAGAALLDRAAAGHPDLHPFGWAPGRPRTLRQMVRWSIATHLGTKATEEEVDALTTYLALLPTPAPQPVPHDSLVLRAARGAAVFRQVGCADCHIEHLSVADPVLALSNGRAIDLRFQLSRDGRPPYQIAAYSDLRAHHMGPSLHDGRREPTDDDLFVTPPLWGVASRAPFLHDGRASSLSEAINAHDGEARKSREAYENLAGGQADLQLFLATLGRPPEMTWLR